jgi:EAL domain-containing protein (putative c-di-GMP-specific phosphodiesterase class I)
VDRSYLESIDELHADGRKADDLLRGVIALGQALGMEVYGEGIEDETQRHRLRTNGVDIGQGYLFARPLPPEEAAALLRGRACVVPSSLGSRLLAAETAPSL